MKKIVTWNVNGLRAALGKDFMNVFADFNADMFCVQETKMQEGQAEIVTEGYQQYWDNAQKKGYSGTLTFTKKDPISEHFGIGVEEHDKEGRVVSLEYDDFYLVNCYTPNSQRGLARLDYRMKWEEKFKEYLLSLKAKKALILCGDLNVAHCEIDIKNASSNRKNAGFTDEERAKMTELLGCGFKDAFREKYPDKIEYTWWSYFGNARENNTGWRIDYFIVSDDIKDKIRDVIIHPEIFGSDHCPVELIIDL